MRLHMDKPYKSAEKLFRKGEKQTVILAEPQVLRQWDDVAKHTDTITGYRNIHFFIFLDGA